MFLDCMQSSRPQIGPQIKREIPPPPPPASAFKKEAGPPSESLKRNLPSTSSEPITQEAKRRFMPDNAAPLEGMTKAELQAALKMSNQSFKELKEIAKQLEQYPTTSRAAGIDPFVTASELVMKKYPQPQIFTCHRCDHTKTSNMKAKFRSKENICGSCFDHLTRCVIPYRDLPDHQRPKQCVHKIPKTIQKQFR
jgi:hypothetical protein